MHIWQLCAPLLPCTPRCPMKQTALGLDISEEACRANCEVLVRAACDAGTRVEMDMEDSSYTDRYLKIVHEMHEKHPGGVRAVIQAYLYRSEADIQALCNAGVPVRLCKGAYKEPESVAFPKKPMSMRTTSG